MDWKRLILALVLLNLIQPSKCEQNMITMDQNEMSAVIKNYANNLEDFIPSSATSKSESESALTGLQTDH